MHPMLPCAAAVCVFAAHQDGAPAAKPSADTAPKRGAGTKESAKADVAPKPTLAVPWPHPLVTEVLFAVPAGEAGDANKDGTRDASGDEFVELVNPHDRPIELRGYSILDGSANPKTRLNFTFPAMTLPPKAVVVLFNGAKSRIAQPVGDPKVAPTGVHASFNKAVIFNMKLPSTRMGFSNEGDACILRAPDQKLVQRIRWGKADEKAGGTSFLLDETGPKTSKASIERDSFLKDSMWTVHADKSNDPFSPGTFTIVAAAADAESKPAAAPTPAETTEPEPAKP